MRPILKISVLGVVLTTLWGCGAARPSKYYQLTVPNAPAATEAREPYPVMLVLGPLLASHLYREDRIVYSSDKEQMGTYDSERWAEPPTEMIQESLLRSLRQSGRYRDVYLMHSSTRGDFILKGRLYDFKEVSGSPLAARVNFEMELHDGKSGATLWVHSYNHDETVSGKSVADVVAALNRNVQRGIAEIAAGLDQYFAAHTVK